MVEVSPTAPVHPSARVHPPSSRPDAAARGCRCQCLLRPEHKLNGARCQPAAELADQPVDDFRAAGLLLWVARGGHVRWRCDALVLKQSAVSNTEYNRKELQVAAPKQVGSG